ncbi:hypothetical protein DL239_18890 [Sedimentitalea sp. CY04]|uniref:Oxygen tolerance n=1 Tax=Parasedimentitalea denitrificans TaxID=2211118 RepID=A0ABX0WC41_9RHOB|nr:BatD family protein [Sedimentitalea sp. CY04]NIZ63036.1 hypothetical protein [Sedimentitalea sp. CY04]
MTSLRALFTMACLLFGMQVAAQDQPQVQVTLSDAPYIVGQPITLRVKILVPTWMPKPPIYPNFEQPGLLVRLPEKSTHPISETVSGQTWSGTTRTYRIYPLEPASYRIPEQTISLTYADDKAQPVQVDLTVEPIEFQAVLPDGAGDMTAPVIIATGFSLEQELAETGHLAVGETVTRRVTAQIDGTTAILIPALISDLIETFDDPDTDNVPPLRAYPKDPTVEETEVAGILSGSRSEEITYLAQSGGEVTLPPIEMDWFNLTTGTIETARLTGVTFQIDEPPAPQMERRQVVILVLTSLVFLFVLIWLGSKVLPRLKKGVKTLVKRWHGSENYARLAVHRAIRSQSLDLLMGQLTLWCRHYPRLSATELLEFEKSMADIGRNSYGPKTDGTVSRGANSDHDWEEVAKQFKVLCRKAREHVRRAKAASALPELNQ